jgi:hypothetical protein
MFACPYVLVTHPRTKKTEQNPTPTKKTEKKQTSRVRREPSSPWKIPSLEATGPVVLAARIHNLPLRRRGHRLCRHPTPRTPASPACSGAASSASLISAMSHAFRCRLATAGQTGQFMATAGQLRARQLPIVEVMVLPPQPSANSSKPPPHSPSRLLSLPNRAGPAAVAGTAAAGIPPSWTCPTPPAVATPPRRPSCLPHQQDRRGLPPSGHRHAAGSGHAAAPSILLTPLIKKALVYFIPQHLIRAFTPRTAVVVAAWSLCLHLQWDA